MTSMVLPCGSIPTTKPTLTCTNIANLGSLVGKGGPRGPSLEGRNVNDDYSKLILNRIGSQTLEQVKRLERCSSFGLVTYGPGPEHVAGGCIV
jgi:hypothetical protein